MADEDHDQDPHEPSNGDRRARRRQQTPGLTLGVRMRQRRRRLLRVIPVWKTVTCDVALVDLSLTGARIRTPREFDLSIATKVELVAGRSSATAVVVHRGNEADGSVAGLEFTGFHNPLTSAFFQQLIATHEHLQLAWND